MRPYRLMTDGERRLACEMFGDALTCDAVRLYRAKWWPLQPRNVVMAPRGHIWFHPEGPLWRDDLSTAEPRLQALLIHELTHVWQHQQGRNLILRRHPFSRYDYQIEPGRPLRGYGIEQQAMIVEHAFTARRAGRPDATLDALLKGPDLTRPLPLAGEGGTRREAVVG